MSAGPTTRFSTVQEVADTLRISKMTVYRLIKSGALPAHQFGRNLRVPTKGVWDYLQGTRVNPADVSRAPVLLTTATLMTEETSIGAAS